MKFLASVICLVATRVIAADVPDFSRDVRPILSQHCFKCHGPDDKARKGGLRLDVRESAVKEAKSGAIALVPAQPDKSELVARIFSKDEDELKRVKFSSPLTCRCPRNFHWRNRSH